MKPNDTIVIEEYGRISIMGQVARPGVYNLKKGLTVMEAIGLAGGFSTTAAQDGTRIIRVEDGKKRLFTYVSQTLFSEVISLRIFYFKPVTP